MTDTWFGPSGSPVVAAAVIAGATSILVSALTQFFGLFSGSRLERLRSEMLKQIESARAELSDLNSSRSARRDYEYDARKRLYAEIEPLLFQLFEAVEQSYYRVRSLARSSRQGSLGQHERSWLNHNGYYLRSTLYYMILPAVIFRLIRNRMTFIDLDLDQQISTKYFLTKIYAYSFTDDFALASSGRKLPYDPDGSGTEQGPPAAGTSSRQGLVFGDLDSVLDLMLKADGSHTRAISFGEFDALLSNPTIPETLIELINIYLNFDPLSKPVLARMLLVQACLSHVVLESFELTSSAELYDSVLRFVNSDEFGRAFAWETEVSSDDRTLVADYITERLSWIPDRGRRQAILT